MLQNNFPLLLKLSLKRSLFSINGRNIIYIVFIIKLLKYRLIELNPIIILQELLDLLKGFLTYSDKYKILFYGR